MASSTEGQIRGLSFSGFFRGRVVNNTDVKKEGRLGVFIPSLITEVPDKLEVPAPSTLSIPTGLFANQKELGLSSQVKRDNYVWARPAAHLVENGGAAGNHGGSYRVPTVGTMVIVYFEGEDVNKPYWLPFSPTVNGDIIAGTNLGKGTNVENAAANWQDPAKRTKIHVLAEHDNGNIIYLDSNADNNSFVIRWANGHTLSIGHAAESGIILQTEKGHMVQLDENSQEIRLRTHTGKVSVVMSDATGDVTITNTGKTTVNSIGDTLVKSAASVTIQAPKISLKG